MMSSLGQFAYFKNLNISFKEKNILENSKQHFLVQNALLGWFGGLPAAKALWH